VSKLHRRRFRLEAAALEGRKRQILRDAFSDVAWDQQWSADQCERDVQAALDGFTHIWLGDDRSQA
jgi:hypothetical protein